MVPAFSMATRLNMDAFPWRAISQLQPCFLQEAHALGSFGLTGGGQESLGGASDIKKMPFTLREFCFP
jgi:hypothetical protein